MEEFLVGLTALTLFGSVIWFWLMFALFIVICFASDIKKNGYYAFGTLIVVSVILYFWGNETFVYFKSVVWNFKNISTYLGVGLLFATIKSFFASRKLAKELKNLPDTSDDSWVTTKSKRRKEFNEELGENVARWWFMWPISLIIWLYDSLLADVWNFIWKKIKGYFLFIVDLGIKSA